MKAFFAVALFVMSAISLAEDRVKVGLDCKAWNEALSGPSSEGNYGKLVYLRGFFDGLILGKSPHQEKFYLKTSYDTLITALDQTCNDYRNSNLWLVSALMIVSMELRGEPKDTVEAETRRLRALANPEKTLVK